MELALPDKLFSSTEVCDILGVSLRTLYRYIESGDMGSIQTPTGRHRFTKKHIEDFLGKGKRVSAIRPVLQKPVVQEPQESEKPKSTVEVSKIVEDVVAEKEEEEISPAEGLSLAEEEREEPSVVLGQEELVEDIRETFYKMDGLDVRGVAKKIKEVAEQHNLKYAFTGLGGLSLHYPIKPFSNLEVYINRDLLNLWIKELNLVEASKLTANLKVKFGDDAISSAESLGGLMVANTSVLAQDLRSEGYDELAEELNNRI